MQKVTRCILLEKPIYKEQKIVLMKRVGMQLPTDPLYNSSIFTNLWKFLFRYQAHSYDEDINAWFSRAIGRPCMLVRCTSSRHRSCKRDPIGMCRENRSQLSFSNEAQLLLVSDDSVLDLNNRLSSSMLVLHLILEFKIRCLLHPAT
jgi:uncharacterized protein YcbX